MKSFYHKTISSIISITLIAGVLLPTTASAWVDVANLGQNTISAIGVVRTVVLDRMGYLKEFVLDVAQKRIAAAIEDRMKRSILDWARNGFDGQPSFISNPKDFVLDAAENEAALFTEQLLDPVNGMINRVCTPFRVDVGRAVANKRLSNNDRSSHSLSEAVRLTECNLDLVVTSGVVGNYYVQGGFEREGGFGPLLQTMTKRSDNPYEAPEIAKELLDARQARAVQESQSISSGGFLPKVVCVDPGPGAVPCRRSEIKVPSSGISSAINKATGSFFENIAGQDEFSETLVNAVIQGFTNRIISRGLGL